MDKTYEVINIYRNYESTLSFTIALYADELEYVRVDKSLCAKISQGFVFIGDMIMITARTSDGIIFHVVDGEPGQTQSSEDVRKEEGSLVYQESGATKQRYLPFLCDILPYHREEEIETVKAIPVYKDRVFQGRYAINDVEISNLKIPVPTQFVAKIHQKTRINMYPNTYNPFFFIIVSSNNIFLKIVFWRESLRNYSNLKVGDIILMEEYKHKRKLPFIDRIEYCTFTESVYFDCEEITARKLCKIEGNKKGTVMHKFTTVRGRVTYLSVLLRYNCNSCIMEYVLCRVGSTNIALFYNSDDDFARIKDGTEITVTELRCVVRAGFEFYMSTIYTQFSIHDDEEVRADDEQECAAVDKENPAKKRQLEDSTAANNQSSLAVFGAIGFIPDYFVSAAEIFDYNGTEVIHDRGVSINLFMKPLPLTFEELPNITLVLNESKKHAVSGILLQIDEDDLTIHYLENGVEQKQPSQKLIFESNFECYLFRNFFDSSAQSHYDELQSSIGERRTFVIESFRADINTILHFVTGVMKD